MPWFFGSLWIDREAAAFRAVGVCPRPVSAAEADGLLADWPPALLAAPADPEFLPVAGVLETEAGPRLILLAGHESLAAARRDGRQPLLRFLGRANAARCLTPDGPPEPTPL